MKKLVLLLGITIAMATSAMEVRPLMIGQSIPQTARSTTEGRAFDLQAAAKEQPLVVIFYRGGWCPFCSRYLGQLQEVEPQLRELGYRIVAISPDLPHKATESMGKGKLSYTLLSDSSMATASAFGMAFEVDAPMMKKLASYNIDIENASGQTHHLLPVPSVFLVGTDGIIDFVYANPDYKTRLAPEVLLAALDDGVGRVLRNYLAHLGNPDFNYFFHSAPQPLAGVPYLHFFVRIVPRLSTPGGFEVGTGMAVNPVAPEAVVQEFSKPVGNSH